MKACRATAKSGMPCRAAATATGLCFFHSNPIKAAELGRIGGMAKRSVPIIGLAVLPSLTCTQQIGAVLDRLAREVYGRKTPTDIAKVLIEILKLQLQALAKCNADERITKVEEQFQRLQLMMQLRDPDSPEPEDQDVEAEE